MIETMIGISLGSIGIFLALYFHIRSEKRRKQLDEGIVAEGHQDFAEIHKVFSEVTQIVRMHGRDDEEILAINYRLKEYYTKKLESISRIIQRSTNRCEKISVDSTEKIQLKEDLKSAISYLEWLRTYFKASDDMDIEEPMWLDNYKPFIEKKDELVKLLKNNCLIES